ncbi:hypothetical protein JOC25_002587 [Solibacillus kalamii]|nr:hypothetical protein [Solibacillus kalamii]
MRFNRIFQQFAGITDAIKAFPLAAGLLVVLFIVNVSEISSTLTNYEKCLAALVVAVFTASVADLISPYPLRLLLLFKIKFSFCHYCECSTSN